MTPLIVVFRGQLPDTEALWEEVRPSVKLEDSYLIVKDSILDKTHAKEIASVYH